VPGSSRGHRRRRPGCFKGGKREIKIKIQIFKIKSVCLGADCFAFGELLDKAPSNQGLVLLVGPFLRQGSFTPVSLRGPAPNGHPCPDGALAASMRLGPRSETCVQPAPKSRFVSSGLFVEEDQKQRQRQRLKPVLRSEPIPLDACAAASGTGFSREEASSGANNFADLTPILWERACSRMLYLKHQICVGCTDPFVSKLTPTSPWRLTRP
jgi:hypothetical protein